MPGHLSEVQSIIDQHPRYHIIETERDLTDLTKGDAIACFYADWCKPCGFLINFVLFKDPVKEALTAYSVDLALIDVDLNKDIIPDGVITLPVYIFYTKGREIARQIGLPLEDMRGPEAFAAKIRTHYE